MPPQTVGSDDTDNDVDAASYSGFLTISGMTSFDIDAGLNLI